ncbi:MAG TPA: hypothetical protein PKI59_00095 [Candidatus Cloacimonadota bacterium]|nr:hypothetical protein [Candidatus Cloacimonadota bacterium]
MQNKEILSADEIRAELARRKISKARLARETGIYYQYLIEVLQGYRPATKMREKITDYLKNGGVV